MEEGEAKEALIRMIANQMKKSYLLWNKDSVDNRKIFKDLADLSEGRIVRDEFSVKLAEASTLTEAPQRTSKKHKKKSRS